MPVTALLRRLAQAEARLHAQLAVTGASEQFGPLVAISLGSGPGQPLPIETAWHDGSVPATAADLQAFEAFCAEHRQDAILHLLSHAAPAMLTLLAERSYQLDYVLHVYVHRLKSLPPASIVPVHRETNGLRWAALAARSFGPGTERIMEAVGQAPGKRLFVASAEGEEVASAAYSLDGGVAVLHSTATRTNFRGRGLHAALLAHRLRAAQAEGADLASVFVTPGSGSERNVERAGFELAGMRLTFTRR
ncbi:hypothetical protein SAMN04488058_10562 [Deinococcus reticulitermitis]|uniref:N-acetyltransferase domain-containing protein n=1 Tax=Deinococcus reticulitermitis TaxID=856736 RepID=A0A1H6XFH7_9DEIO|nr:GNAT family N-acetyltransferase [Deinococcus reticulitermitis]SEJ23325.1 hypothetical protein SAMN04488058_10562 [Deinococcus reticulitermitis]